MNTIKTTEPMITPSKPMETAWVHEALEPDQLSTAKPQYGRRALNQRTRFLLWAMRVYLVLMVWIIVLEIQNAIKTRF